MLDKNELVIQGLVYTAMGIIIVFMILVIIMLVIKAMALFSTERKPKAVEVTPAFEPQRAAVTEEKQDDSEIIAAITAAIAVVTEQSASDFVVRSYKKVSGGAWNKAGRREMLENRF